MITAFGVDAAFSYKYNMQLGICARDGLAICPGFTTTHVIPVSFPGPHFYLLCQYLSISVVTQHYRLL